MAVDIPFTALASDGTEQATTLAKVLNDLDEQEAVLKRSARRCSGCGKYQRHEQLKTVPTDDGGTKRLCSDCLDGDPTAKALYRQGWAEAGRQMDEALAKMRDRLPRDTDALAKARASDRLARFDAVGNFGKLAAHYRQQWDAEDRLVRMVKAEMVTQETSRLRKQTKQLKKRTKAARLRKAQALQGAADMTAQVQAFQDEVSAQIDGIAERVNRVVANAEKAYGGLTRQRDLQATAEKARRDQERADWLFKAGRATDPILRAGYLANAEAIPQ